jgi:hypothetical protein
VFSVQLEVTPESLRLRKILNAQLHPKYWKKD